MCKLVHVHVHVYVSHFIGSMRWSWGWTLQSSSVILAMRLSLGSLLRTTWMSSRAAVTRGLPLHSTSWKEWKRCSSASQCGQGQKRWAPPPPLSPLSPSPPPLPSSSISFSLPPYKFPHIHVHVYSFLIDIVNALSNTFQRLKLHGEQIPHDVRPSSFIEQLSRTISAVDPTTTVSHVTSCQCECGAP